MQFLKPFTFSRTERVVCHYNFLFGRGWIWRVNLVDVINTFSAEVAQKSTIEYYLLKTFLHVILKLQLHSEQTARMQATFSLVRAIFFSYALQTTFLLGFIQDIVTRSLPKNPEHSPLFAPPSVAGVPSQGRVQVCSRLVERPLEIRVSIKWRPN